MARMKDLDRRSFLARSALGAGALLASAPALGASGCGARHAMPELGGLEADALAARLERGLSRVRDFPAGQLAEAFPDLRRPELSENILRTTLGGLVVADVARSVPDAVRVPRGLAEPLTGALPLVGESAELHHALLTRMPSEAKRSVGARIRERPATVTDVAEWIDGQGRELGVARESRLELRRAAMNVGVRMRRQSASAVIDDAVQKVGRVVARSGSSYALQRSAAVAAMIDAIWQEGVPGGAGASLTAPSATYLAAAPYRVRAPSDDEAWSRFLTPEGPPRWSAEFARPGDEERRIGFIMMPFGAISCGLFLIIGLIVMIAGSVQNGDWDGMTRAEQDGQ